MNATFTKSLTYRQLQAELKAIRSSGVAVNCKLNQKDEVLRSEYERLTSITAVKPVTPKKVRHPEPSVKATVTPNKVLRFSEQSLCTAPKPVTVKSQPTEVSHNVVLKGYEPSPVGYVPLKRYAYNSADMPNRLAAEPKPYRRVTDVRDWKQPEYV